MMTSGPTILVVEGESSDRETLAAFLSREGFDVCVAATGSEALAGCNSCDVAAVLLDAVLPDLSGAEVCRRMRATSSVPIIMVTAGDAAPDPVTLFEVGADDCITRPVRLRELVARLRATLRRAPPRLVEPPRPAVIQEGNVRLDSARHQVTVAGRLLYLPPKEFALLEILLCHQGEVLRRNVIMERVWGAQWKGGSKTLDAHISRLRQRLDEAGASGSVTTIRGWGYRYETLSNGAGPPAALDDPVIDVDLESRNGEGVVSVDLDSQEEHELR
jgi:two-component system response regulator RegX3